ncbi:acyltransferase family protein [Streptomyces formicae]|uniref:Acyltransferase n=1 Tax=Streptomyces formicae TaxID=1616117 RepID=A0ABY3WSI1_9ACTN|nr:acyltransferase [Streptomyces formicae]UNM15589.1 acyltransferase [Streptomyces formicae]
MSSGAGVRELGADAAPERAPGPRDPRDGADRTTPVVLDVAGPADKKPRDDRLRALDGLRILAALSVCIFHYAGKGQVGHAWGGSPKELFPDLSAAATYGNLGVQLFFIISGFVICMSSWGKSLGHFFRSRVSRLYPAYWVAIVLTCIACFALPSVIAPLRLDEIIVNFTMLQQPMGANRVLGVCWTLWVEAKFYLLFALFVVWKGVTYRRVVIFCCLWTVAGVLARVADHPLTDQIVMRDHAPFFIGGLALYLIHRYGSDLLLWGIVGVSWAFGQRYAISALWDPNATNVYLERNPHVILAIVTLAYLAVAAVALGWLRWANWRWLTFAGALTYPFYLVHEHIGWFVISVLSRKLHLPAWPTLLLTIGAMLTLAWLIHRLVEKPFGPRMRRTMESQAARLKALAAR